MSKDQPPVVVRKPTKYPTQTKYAERYHTKGGPAPRSSGNPKKVPEPIERAAEVLGTARMGEVRDGRYLLDGKLVSLGVFLRAANDLIARQNLTLPRHQQQPLIGHAHHRWGQ